MRLNPFEKQDLWKQMYYQVAKRLMRHWVGHENLPDKQARLLIYINERTLRFGKLAEYMPMRQFIRGIQDHQTGEIIVQGFRCDKKTIRTHLLDLEEKGFIHCVRAEVRGEWSGNAYYLNVIKIMEKAPRALLEIGDDSQDMLKILKENAF